MRGKLPLTDCISRLKEGAKMPLRGIDGLLRQRPINGPWSNPQKNHRPDKLTGGPQLHFSNKMSKPPRMNDFDSRTQRYDIFWHFKTKRAKKLHFHLFLRASPFSQSVLTTISAEMVAKEQEESSGNMGVKTSFLHFFCRFFWRYHFFAYLCNRKTMVP